MKKFITPIIFAFSWTILMLGVGWGISECTASPTNMAGKWLGTITVPGVELRIDPFRR